MSIVILYESEEWSNFFLRDYLSRQAIPVHFVNFEKDPVDWQVISQARLVVNRLFPSAYARHHEKTYYATHQLMARIHAAQIPMINSYEAFLCDFDKERTSRKLTEISVANPCIFCNSTDFQPEAIIYPCIVKPNRGGRSLDTHLVRSRDQLDRLLPGLPDIPFIFQEYIEPVDDCTLRLEVIDRQIVLAFRRSLDQEGLSSYHRGARYQSVSTDNPEYRQLCLPVMQHLNLKMASFDLIRGHDGMAVIDVNATSNYAEDDLVICGFNPIEMMADLIMKEYSKLMQEQEPLIIRYEQ